MEDTKVTTDSKVGKGAIYVFAMLSQMLSVSAFFAYASYCIINHSDCDSKDCLLLVFFGVLFFMLSVVLFVIYKSNLKKAVK